MIIGGMSHCTLSFDRGRSGLMDRTVSRGPTASSRQPSADAPTGQCAPVPPHATMGGTDESHLENGCDHSRQLLTGMHSPMPISRMSRAGVRRPRVCSRATRRGGSPSTSASYRSFCSGRIEAAGWHPPLCRRPSESGRSATDPGRSK